MIASAVRYLVQVVALAAVYFVAAKGGLLLATEGAQVTLVWPPSELVLAALRFVGSRLWPASAPPARLVGAALAPPDGTARRGGGGPAGGRGGGERRCVRRRGRTARELPLPRLPDFPLRAVGHVAVWAARRRRVHGPGVRHC